MAVALELELKTAVRAVQLASAISLAVQREQAGAHSPMQKGEKDPVTIADYAAQAVILHTLSASFPDDAVLAEESTSDFDRLASEDQRGEVIGRLEAAFGHPVTLEDVRTWLDYGRGRTRQRMWTIDPIDGTKGFIRNDQFALAIALLIDHQPVLGVLACPRLPYHLTDTEGGVIATALKGRGAELQALDGSARRKLKTAQGEMAETIRLAGSMEKRHTNQDYTENLLTRAGLTAETIRVDSQVKYVMLADNRADVYIRQSSTSGYIEKIWDHVAGALIVEEAGGIVTDLTGARLDYTTGAELHRNKGVLAAAAGVHPRLLAAAMELQK
jgi:3'(2'), 5'-bisphosphate nucleotidase